jgi:predicted cytidylate kinase
MVNSKRPIDQGLLIVVGGPGKSGSSTISKMLARHFGLNRIYAGQLMESFAKAEGFNNVIEFLAQISDEHLDELDKKIDSKILRFSQLPNVLVESKVFAALASKYRIPCTVKIWLDADISVRVKRSKEGKRVESEAELSARFNQDLEKFKRAYNIDYSSPKKYNDIVLDTSKLNVYQTFKLILKIIEDGRYISK